MSKDTIYRQAAIDVVSEHCGICIQRIVDLPSAQPERIRGRWQPFDLTWGRSIYACSVCGQGVDVPTEMGTPIYRYCPQCGADMRETDGSED